MPRVSVSRFALHAGLVTFRQTFVLRCLSGKLPFAGGEKSDFRSRIARCEVGYNRQKVLLVESGYNLDHQRAPFSRSGAVPEVIELSEHVARRTTSNVWQRSKPSQVRAMAKRALDRFARPTFHDKCLAFGEAPDWYIGCEGRSRVPAFEAEQIVGDLHDPRSDRLALAGLHRSPKQPRHIGLWRGVALDHLDAFARLQGRKVSRRGFDFGVSGQLRKLDH